MTYKSFLFLSLQIFTFKKTTKNNEMKNINKKKTVCIIIDKSLTIRFVPRIVCIISIVWCELAKCLSHSTSADNVALQSRIIRRNSWRVPQD